MGGRPARLALGSFQECQNEDPGCEPGEESTWDRGGEICHSLMPCKKSVSATTVAGRKLLRQIADRVGEIDRFLVDHQFFEGKGQLVSPELNSLETLKKESSE